MNVSPLCHNDRAQVYCNVRTLTALPVLTKINALFRADLSCVPKHFDAAGQPLNFDLIFQGFPCKYIIISLAEHKRQ
jgi:hypothetical protein